MKCRNRWMVCGIISLFCATVVGLSARAEDGAAKPQADEPIRVACVGDSITAGVGAGGGMSYPDQLGKLLGAKYKVRNFGVSGTTLLKKGDSPYIRTGQYGQAKAYKPQILIVKLGTNDSKPQNWKFKDEYATDYKEMIEVFKAASPEVKIYLCKPVPAFPGNWGIDDGRIKELLPVIDQVAKDNGCQVIDLYKALEGKPDCVPDKVHPNAKGAGLMAAEVARVLTGEKVPATEK